MFLLLGEVWRASYTIKLLFFNSNLQDSSTFSFSNDEQTNNTCLSVLVYVHQGFPPVVC